MNRSIRWAFFAGLLFIGMACSRNAETDTNKSEGDSSPAKKEAKAVTIKLRSSAAGDVVLVTKNQKTTTATKIKSKEGNVLKDDSDVTTEIAEYEETIVKREGTKAPEKIERLYSEWKVKTGDANKDVPHKGKRIVIEKKNGKYGVALKEAGKIDRMAESILLKEFADKSEDSEVIEKLMFPSTPVKPGGTWEIDMDKVAAEMSKSAKMTIDASKASGSGKLLKTYKKDGKQFGKLTIDMKMPITEIAMPRCARLMPMAARGRLIARRTLSAMGMRNKRIRSANSVATPMPVQTARPMPNTASTGPPYST